jgi:MraZ protein
VGDFMLMGEYIHNLDNKGRIIIPSKFRNEFDGKIIVTRGLDGCLFGYNKETWNDVIEQLNKLSFTKKDTRNFMRFFTSGAISLEFDKQGRINIPSYLLDYASLKNDVIIIGVINRIEIWDKEKWHSFMKENVENLSDISENLFDSSLGL